jgi:hypothetical protein
VQTRGPTCQGIDAPRHYQHTFILAKNFNLRILRIFAKA